MWGGRFAAGPDRKLLTFSSSFDDDRALADADVRGSLAHVETLFAAGLLSRDEAAALEAALQTVALELRGGKHDDQIVEDIHSVVEARVTELAGAAGGGKLHTGRSRNDQVATDIALFARDALAGLCDETAALSGDILDRAQDELSAGTLLIGTTHWQPAQPILLAFWLHAAAVGSVRQARRLRATCASIARCPLGASALAGSSLALDRTLAARRLGFADGPTENALDTVGDRDGLLDTLYACAALSTYLSRLSAELIIWCSPLVGFATLGDAVARGSSLMPQKRNPDIFELVRAKAATVAGYLSAALSQIHGLGLSYHSDLQESKRMLILGVKETSAMLGAFRTAFVALRFDRARCDAAARDPLASATEAADLLVRAGIPFRRAHQLVGERVRLAEIDGRALDPSDVAACVARARGESADVRDVPAGFSLDAVSCVRAKWTAGSTNPVLLAGAIRATQDELREFGAFGESA